MAVDQMYADALRELEQTKRDLAELYGAVRKYVWAFHNLVPGDTDRTEAWNFLCQTFVAIKDPATVTEGHR